MSEEKEGAKMKQAWVIRDKESDMLLISFIRDEYMMILDDGFPMGFTTREKAIAWINCKSDGLINQDEVPIPKSDLEVIEIEWREK